MTTRIQPSSTPTTSGTGAGLEGNAPTTPAAPDAPATGTTSTSEFDGAAPPAATAASAGGETAPSPSKGKQAQMNVQKPVTKTPEPPAKKPTPTPAPAPKIPETPAKAAPAAPKPTPAPAPKAPETPAKQTPPVQAAPTPAPKPQPAPTPAKPPETPAKPTPPVQAKPEPTKPAPAPAPAPPKQAPPVQAAPTKPAPAPAPPKQPPPVQAAPTKPAPAPAPPKQTAPVQQKPVSPLPPTLKVENGAVVTPGGYKIIPTKQYEWKIVGPDGKSTRVWGDPHVAEGDGGKWDFKKDSVFVLPDGTKVAVTTTPWGKKGATVTKRLDIIAGNDHIDIQGIATGKGKIGSLQNDGQAVAAGLRGDEFVMGSQTDDWYLGGKEIISSSASGNTLKLRDGSTVRSGATGRTTGTTTPGIAALRANTEAAGGARAWYDNVSSSLMPLLSRTASGVTTPGVNAYSTPGLLPSASANAPYDAAAQQQAIMEALMKIFQLLAALQGTGGTQQPRVFNA